MLSGTGSNRGTKCIRRLARFNPRWALIGFLGTRAWYPQYAGTDERTLLSYLLRIVHSSWSIRGQISRLFRIQLGKGQYDEIWWAFFEIEESIDSRRPHISNSFNGRGTESNKTGEWISWVPAKRTTES